MKATFYRADIFDTKSALAQALGGKVDIQVSGDFLHLFDWKGQVEAACSMVALSRPMPGSMIIGKQIGRSEGTAVQTAWGKRDTMFFHDETTFRAMWDEVEQRTGTRWHVRVKTVVIGDVGFWGPLEDYKWMSDDARGLQFVLTRAQLEGGLCFNGVGL